LVLCPNKFPSLPDWGRIATQFAFDGGARVWGRNTGEFMSGHWRLCIGASLLLAGLSTSPAFSNPLTDLFTPAPQEAPAAAPAPAKQECLPQPGRATPGQHWVYHLDGHRRCWFQTEASVAVKKVVERRAPRRRIVEPEENEEATHRKSVADARAQLLSDAQANALQPAAPAPAPAPAPEMAADTASVPASEPATPVPAAPVATAAAAAPIIDQPAPARTTRPQVDVEMLLAAAAPITDAVAAPAPSATPAAPSIPAVLTSQWESVTTLAGAILMVFGLVFLIGSLLAAVAGRTPARMV
jgi:hypothetical protein